MNNIDRGFLVKHMRRVTAFVGSGRKKHTDAAAVQFPSNLPSLGDIECEIVRLSNYRLGGCKGCRVCMQRGEEHCPFKDHRDVLIEKMMRGVVELAEPSSPVVVALV